jgi:hypothetical protein
MFDWRPDEAKQDMTILAFSGAHVFSNEDNGLGCKRPAQWDHLQKMTPSAR